MTTFSPRDPAANPASSPPTFGDQVLAFVRTWPRPVIAAAPVTWLDPFATAEANRCADAFYRAFYHDYEPRLFIFGVNPGRFGAGVTGVPLTDGYALAHGCGIPNTLPPRRELSAEFFHRVVAAWGGAAELFGQIYVTSVCPLGLLRDGKNFNYYDDPAVLRELEPFLIDAIRRQRAFGARPAAVVLGSGENLRVLTRLNAAHGLFDALHALPHPRFVMQYRRTQVDEFVAEYVRLFREVLGQFDANSRTRIP